MGDDDDDDDHDNDDHDHGHDHDHDHDHHRLKNGTGWKLQTSKNRMADYRNFS